MAFASRKRPAVLRDDEVGDCLLGSKTEESLSNSECDSEKDVDDCALLDGVEDGDSDARCYYLRLCILCMGGLTRDKGTFHR
jgi:hypothetical protein